MSKIVNYEKLRPFLIEGDYISFNYDNQERTIKIDSLSDNYVQGYDIVKEGYRRFSADKLHGRPASFLMANDQGEVLSRRQAEERAGIKFEYDDNMVENRIKVAALCGVIAAKDKTILDYLISKDCEIVGFIRKTDFKYAIELLYKYL